METLSPSRSGHTKIDDVLWAFLPAIGLRYFARLVDQLLYDLLQWNRLVSKRILDRTLDAKSYTVRERLFRLLALEQSRDLREDLYANLGNFELLRFRLFKASELFGDPTKIVAALDAHQKRVEWQLRRIYRVRNSIVHLGETPSFTIAVADNAHDYLDQIIHLTFDLSCGPNGFRTYAEMFTYLREEYALYHNKLKTANTPDERAKEIFWARHQVPTREHVIKYPR